MVDILVEVRVIERADPLLQPPLQHQPLAGRQLDADLALDQFGNRAEMTIRQMRRERCGPALSPWLRGNRCVELAAGMPS